MLIFILLKKFYEMLRNSGWDMNIKMNRVIYVCLKLD